MENHVCPVWIGYWLASPIRKLWQNPGKILAPYVKEKMTTLDVGSAMGFFSLPMARMVGSSGKVICVDLQEKMIGVLTKKAQKLGLIENIETVICSPDSLNIEKYKEQVNFALAFAVLHEAPDQTQVFKEIYNSLKPGGKLLFSEPSGHVTEPDFKQSLSAAEENKFKIVDRLRIKSSHSAVLQK